MAEQYIKPHVPNAVPKMENVDICGLSARYKAHSSLLRMFLSFARAKRVSSMREVSRLMKKVLPSLSEV